MDHFTFRDGRLHCEELAAADIAVSAGTPCYVYSLATFLDHYNRLIEAFSLLDPLICYSIKSCSNLAICRALGEAGSGMDLVSGGELHRAILAGIDPSRCVYAGVGKTDAEIDAALDAGVGWFNVESESEFENLSQRATAKGTRGRAALRVNPDVDPKTHRYTTTGKKETKFGVDLDRARVFFKRYGNDPHVALSGIHIHLGSPIYTVQPYVRATEKILQLIDELDGQGHAVTMLDIGGGFGADYETDQSPPAKVYADALVPLLKPYVDRGLLIVIEPGRMISANAGVLLLRVLYVKTSGEKTFVICDGGMNTLLRPSHYEAFHFMWPAVVDTRFVPASRREQMDMTGLVTVDVVGPICETGDFLALDRALPPISRGDLLVVFAAGAYGMAMANRYNSMPLPAEILVDGTTATVVRRRETYDDLTAHEQVSEVLPVSESTLGARR